MVPRNTHFVEETLRRYFPDDATALLAPRSLHVPTTGLDVPAHLVARRALLENAQVGGCARISAWQRKR